MANAIVGTLLIVGAACLIGIPIGIGAGIFCAEYPGNRMAGQPLRGRRAERDAVDRGRRVRVDLDRGPAEAPLGAWPGARRSRC